MAMSRQALAPWWPAVWLVTSAVLIAASSQIESGWFLAAFYVALNACAVLYVALGDRSARARQMTIVGWCVAAQLPAMIWPFVSGRRERERLHAHKLLDDDQPASGPPTR